MQKSKAKNGWLVILALSLFPFLPWLTLRPLSERFADGWTTATSLGQLAGLVGMAMFGLAIILSARTKWLDKHFAGLNIVYIKHHQVGAISFVLLLLHPLLLAVKYGQTSWHLAAQFFLPSANLPLNYGKASLVLMILLLLLTFYVRLPYQIWKLSHKFLGLAYFLAILHLLFISSDTSQSLVLKGYLLLISLLALAAVFYRVVDSKALVKSCQYRVEAVNRISGAVVEIIMKPAGGEMSYNPGQFVFIAFDQDGFRERHPFTISSAGNGLSVAVKGLGDYTSKLPDLKIGTSASIEGPYGQFSYHHSVNKKQVWLAGGIGITPFLSMARSLGDSSDYDIDLIYCSNNAGEAVFIDELKSLAETRSWFRVHGFFSDEQGKISADIISKITGGLKERDFFLCGPPGMMGAIKTQLKNYDIPSELLHSEEFAMI
ncbi:hypothetical protein HGA34_05475 [Candidatus Falkowbacteria bacterium]|nr:hypothetical protein [Candidatus Falkowbacteria bacterium]